MGPPRSSKKRPQTNRAYRRVKEISRWKKAYLKELQSALSSTHHLGAERSKSVRTADTTALRDLADSAACFFCFSSGDESQDDCNDNQHRNGNSNVQRRDQTCARRWSGSSRRGRRCVFRRQHSLHVLQTLHSVIIVWF